MNFNQTESRRMLTESLDRYLGEQYGIRERHAISVSATGYSAKHWAALADMGAIGALFSEDQGGYGGEGFDIATVFEALGRGLVVEPFLASGVLAGSALVHAGNREQRALIAGLIDGSHIATLAHEEADSRYAFHQVATQAVRAGEGYVISGAKAVVPFGDQAQTLVVSARTSGATTDASGISLFLVPASAPGVTLRGHPNADGTRAAAIAFDQVRVPASALLGAEGAGLATLEFAIGRSILALCAEALGIMDVIRRFTVEYLQTRKQFGKPIGSFQALQHRMATVLLEIEQARSAVINAASNLSADRITRERSLSAAKLTIGRTGTLVAEECIQLHGGMGVAWEMTMPHYAKRLVMIDHQLGDEDHHLARYIALGQAA
jgi:alkylation response protein AidB-like acyl-CoA dehydrogenase